MNATQKIENTVAKVQQGKQAIAALLGEIMGDVKKAEELAEAENKRMLVATAYSAKNLLRDFVVDGMPAITREDAREVYELACVALGEEPEGTDDINSL